MRVTSSSIFILTLSLVFNSSNAFTTTTTSPTFCSTNSQIQSSSTTTTTTTELAVTTSDSGDISRSTFFQKLMVMGGTTAATTTTMTLMHPTFLVPPAYAEEETKEEVKLPSGTSYVIVKSGNGPRPKIGELAGIRFKAEVLQTGNKIDDIFDTPEPYYTRIGSGGLLKGVEEVLPSMCVGDRFLITVPTSMAFGPKGRPASAGKPRIPGDAIITFEVEMVGLPGREQELIDLIGDD